jgi:LacI family transcriptional regulator
MPNSPRKSATLRDVALLAGIDKATASRALNGKGGMSPATRDAVFKAAQELRYQPDLYALRLKSGAGHNTIALLPRRDLGVMAQQATFINHRLEEIGFEVQSSNISLWIAEIEERQVALVNRVCRQRPGAIICGFIDLFPETLEKLRLFMQEGGVVVGYGNKTDLDCDQVVLDAEHRGYLATRHLLELGHRELGFCIHGGNLQDSADVAGFRRAMEEFGAAVEEDWIFGGGHYEEGGARLAQAYLDWPKKPTGLCIINDVSASVFVTALHLNGYSVPDDVSVVGCDDAPIARYALVPLTTVSYPLEVIGNQVVELTQSRLNGYDGPPRMVTAQSELIPRRSSAPCSQRVCPKRAPLPNR